MSKNKKNVFSNKNFKNLWIGNVISAIGDQLSIIALPWLVLKLTGSSVAVGTVLGIISIPRAFLMLFGGALTDRFKPRNILILTRVISCAVLLLLTGLLLMGIINLSLLYVIALVLGVTSAFAIPAVMALLPSILEPEQLNVGNGITMSTMQLSMVLGPILAGYLIVSGDGFVSSDPIFKDAFGLALVFFVDALTFLFSVLSLMAIKLPQVKKSSGENSSIIMSIIDGFNYMKADNSLKFYMFYIAIVSFFIVGPSTVGIPIMVETKFLGNASQFGYFMTVQGAGMTIGTLMAAMMPAIQNGRLGITILTLDFIAGLFVFIFAHTVGVKLACSLLLVIGMIGGFIQVRAFTWVQKRIDTDYAGRIMSFLMFASVGLSPLSAAGAGLLIAKTSVSTMFSVMGGVIMFLAFMTLILSSDIRNMGAQKRQILDLA